MSSLSTEKKIYDDLIASLRAASRSRAEAILAPVPAQLLLGYGGESDSGTSNMDEHSDSPKEVQKKGKNWVHNRHRSAHAIGDHRIYGTNHFPVSTRADSIRQAMEQDLLEEEAKDNQGAKIDKANGFTLRGTFSNNSSSMENLDYVSEMLQRAKTTRDAMDSEERSREEASAREAAFLARIKDREDVAREATEKEILRNRVTILVNRKFGAAATPVGSAVSANEACSEEQSIGVHFDSERRVEELEELWERRNSHLMKKASRRKLAPAPVEGDRGPVINAYYHAIRRSSLAISLGATNVMKSKISAYQLLGVDPAEKIDKGQIGSIAELWK